MSAVARQIEADAIDVVCEQRVAQWLQVAPVAEEAVQQHNCMPRQPVRIALQGVGGGGAHGRGGGGARAAEQRRREG